LEQSEIKSPTFLFYETTKGFYCVSLEDLIVNQIESEMIYSEYVFNANTHQNEIKENYSNVENITFKTNLDIIQSQDLGHFTSSLYTFDMIKKEDALYYYDHSFRVQRYCAFGVLQKRWKQCC